MGLLKKNLEVLKSVQDRTGAKIILALKGFAMHSTFPLIREYLCGTTASSLNEAKLGFEEFGKEVHVCAPAYQDNEFYDLMLMSNHIVFNSLNQWQRYKDQAVNKQNLHCGLRINPEHSEVKVEKYNPCSSGSRLGITLEQLQDADLSGITGLHFHTLCELGADALERTLAVFEKKFAPFIKEMKWINFGGGHHITRQDYDVDLLCKLIDGFKKRYSVDVYMEPGEAIALNTGVLVTTVLDIIDKDIPTVILDTSASAHMPDVLEMPYKPEIMGASSTDDKAHKYRLGGLTCLAGDVIGEYSFDEPLKIGDKLSLLDMAHYTMVKNTSFNGVNLPSIVTYDPASKEFKLIRKFDYKDYKGRLS
jgi:carboxynorspermidine decarboxylase